MGRIATLAFGRNQNMLDSTAGVLNENITDVSQTLAAERAQISETRKQEQLTTAQKQKEAEELKNIQKRKAALQKELDRRRADAKRLEGIITNLIAKEEAERKAKEEARKRRLAELQRKKKSGKKLTTKEKKQEQEDSVPIKEAPGPRSLSWPVSSHRVAQGFGEVRNKELGTVTMNLGIDIATPSGSSVHAAEEGTVSIVSSLPSYGTIVIINHSGGVHTVYADLASAHVSRGEKVSRGMSIGSSGENSELGGILHFEVWKGRAKQNPMGWLR
jgi:septal ring factor EnvC (AmiA/AmiB activator)